MRYTTIAVIGGTILAIFAIGAIGIEFLGDYGVTVFILIPLLIGFLPPFVIGRLRNITLSNAYKYSFGTLGLVILCLLAFAFEGVICILMALPPALFLTWVGSYVGYALSKKGNSTTNSITILVLALSSVGSMSFDHTQVNDQLIAVKTTVVIDAPIETVWNNVVTFDTIAQPTDWLFKTGIAYPTHATIKGSGNGAVRYCNFTTGSFVEPITNWQEPTLLQFDVEKQPAPMNEFNPFWDIHPKHLDGYFVSHRGQFRLTPMGTNRTKLEGTTFYTLDIMPQFYWQMWSDFIIHRIHLRVLNHIKKESEGN